ncbi:MAG TPA: S-adenosylmethionine:tRNA ribosyltransferase-isomerase [Chitinophagaceae bacterium]|nr:S-adenosylmethionine:tRNA ribosyltransferase-isomerase [Chitinophagaceae bacterium]
MNRAKEIKISDFDYELPNGNIAAYPLPQREASKLLVYRNGTTNSTTFSHLPEYLSHKSTVVLNNSRVIEARLLFQKPSKGIVEIFCLEPVNRKMATTEAMETTGSVQWLCLIGGASKWKKGEILEKELVSQSSYGSLQAAYMAKVGEAFQIELSWTPAHLSFAEVLHATGAMPLPPYIKRKAETADRERYQTVFAEHKGSVAAPTAALHFTPSLLSQMEEKDIKTTFVTLHIGAGTFKPVKTETIAEHSMHAEQFQLGIKELKILQQNRELVAVGTTTLRTLESLFWIGIKILQGTATPSDLTLGQWEAYELSPKNITYGESIEGIINFMQQHRMQHLVCETSLLIVPGYQFRSAEALITNFHQPRSTLLLLVAAFIGHDWKKVYQHALENNFRFLSYGDSSLLWRRHQD